MSPDAPASDRPPDFAVGAFTSHAPWVVNPDTMPWRVDIDRRRQAAAARVPDLVRHRRLPPGRGATVAWKLARTGLAWYLSHRRDFRSPVARADLAARLRRDFEHLGTTFLKLGQLIGSSDGMMSAEFVQEFKLCRDRVPPESFPHVRSVIEEDFGRPIDSLFAAFDPVPIAAASIAQVHAATLTDGTEVVVKVQRPNIDIVVPKDIATMSWIAPLASKRAPEASLANLPAYVELFADTIVEELDFRLEAENMLDIAAVLARTDERSVVVPRPHPELVSRRVLVMERIHGFSTDDEAALADNGVDPTPVFRSLMVSFFEGAMIHGVFHGDLHGGNMMVTDGGRPAIFDFGITGRFTEAKRTALLGLMLNSASQDGRAMLGHFRDLGGFPEGADMDRIAEELDIDTLMTQNPADLTPDAMALQMREVMHRLVQHGAKLPKELFLYLKGMVYLNGAITSLAADLDVFGEMAHIYAVIMEQHPDEVGALVDIESMPAEADIVDLMRQQTGIDSQSATYREMQEANAKRQAEIREALKRLK